MRRENEPIAQRLRNAKREQTEMFNCSVPGSCKRLLYLGEVTNGQSRSGRPYQTLDIDVFGGLTYGS